MQNQSIAIIGMGAIFPKARNLKDFWRLILNGRDAVTDVPETHWSPEEYFNADRDLADYLYCKRGGFLEPFDFDPAQFGIPPNNLDATDTSQLLGLVAANMALENAGYGANASFNREKASVVLGVTGTQELVIPLSSRLSHPRWRKAMQAAGVSEPTAGHVMQLLSESYVKWQENSFPGLLGNVVAGRISNRLDLRGTNCVVDAACASSLGALHLALLELASGTSDLVVTGGADTLNDVFMHMCFCQTGVLSPTGDIRPFSANADGTVLGEGIGMVVLKRLADAERDNDRIYAVIKGLGSSSDGKSQSIYAPNAKGQERALLNAYAAANIAAETVELIEGHGTGTLVGDKVEVSALEAVFKGAKPHQTAIGSVKALVGHTKAAAGSAGLIKAALALHHKVLPPSIKVDAPNQILTNASSPFYLNTHPKPWVANSQHPRRAGVSAFGFGGSNFHAVLEEYKPAKQHISWDNTAQIAAFSAATLNDLQVLIKAFAALNLSQMNDELAWQAMQTRQSFNANHDFRLLLSIDENSDIAAILNRAQDIAAQGMPHNDANIYFGHGKPQGALAFVFPGQGSQYLQMGANYVTRFPQALNALELFNSHFEGEAPLSDYIYPPAAFSEEERKARLLALTQTQIAQPALGAVSLGMALILDYFDLTPQFAIGHSYGELSALRAAGWLNNEAFAQMSIARGLAVANACEKEPPGGMLAVYAPSHEMETFTQTCGLDICVANINAHNQTVLAGRDEDVKTAAGLLRKQGFKCTPLMVSGAFHSKFVKQAQALFANSSAHSPITPANINVISNITGQAYPQNAEQSRQLLNQQVISPVNFLAGIEELYNKDVRVFVEVGPKTVLSGLISGILNDKDVEVLSMDKSKGRGGLMDLAEVLCRLAALGYNVNLAKWEEDLAKPRKQIMRVPLCGANLGPKGVTADNAPPPPPQPKAAPKPVPIEPVAVVPAPVISQPATPALAAPLSYKQNASHVKTIMNKDTSLNIIEQSLTAIKDLQEQVTRAHEKFLDTQAEANRTLQSLLYTLGGGEISPPQPATIPQAQAFAPVSAFAAPTPQTLAPITAAAATAPTVTPAPAPAAVQAAPKAKPQPGVASELLAVVSELTGYPADMLTLDMQIEGDLGIDSIKRVEILSTLEERLPNLPQTDPEEMAALKTLGEIVAVLGDNSTQSEAPKNAPIAAAAAPSHDITACLMQVVSELTGYPADMLTPDMQIEGDLGIDSIKRVEILSTLEERLPNLPQTDPEEMAALKTLGEIAAALSCSAAPPAAQAETMVAETKAQAMEEPPQTTGQMPQRRVIKLVQAPVAQTAKPDFNGNPIVLTGANTNLLKALAQQLETLGAKTVILDKNAALSQNFDALQGLVISSDSDANDDGADLLQNFKILRHFGPGLLKGANAFVLGLSRLNGAFGFSAKSPVNSQSAGLAGLLKTAQIEWPQVSCHMVDIDPEWQDAAAVTKALTDELYQTDGLETGLAPNARTKIALEPAELPQLRKDAFNSGDVFVVTGGARGVTARAAIALSRAFAPKLALLGRSPEPFAEPQWLQGLTAEGEMKKAIIANDFKNITAQPKDVAAKYKTYIANREISANLAQMRELGADARYYQVNILDKDALTEAFAAIKRDLGPVTALVHGAGVLEDKLLLDKTDEQFGKVYAAKVNGLQNLLYAAGNAKLKAVALFSSVTARMGNKGQCDYAAANEILNKTAQNLALQHKNARVVSFNWGPWNGGMVSPLLKKEFAEMNVELIDLEGGAVAFVRELAAKDSSVEVVFGSGFDALLPKAVYTPAEPEAKASKGAPSPMRAASNCHHLFDIDVSPQTFPVLGHHMIDGDYVMPFAISLELLASAAMHENPGLKLAGINNARVLKGLVLPAKDPKAGLGLYAAKAKSLPNGQIETEVELRALQNGKPFTVATAGVVLSPDLSQAPNILPLELQNNCGITSAQVYQQVLFHGKLLQGLTDIKACDAKGAEAMALCSGNPKDYLAYPLRSRFITDPLALDCAFQLASLWCQQNHKTVSLPSSFGSLKLYGKFKPNAQIKIALNVKLVKGQIMKGGFTFYDGNDVIAVMDDFDAVMSQSLNQAFKPQLKIAV